MTMWLWIIGAVAVLWPIALAWMVTGYDQLGNTNRFISLSEALSENLTPFRERMTAMQNIIEEQDALIAALWAKTYGYRPSENDPLIHSWVMHPETAHGVRPPWKIWSGENRKDELSRVGNYPWRERADS